MVFDGELVKGNANLREKALLYFHHLYTEEEGRRLKLDELPFKQLSADSRVNLEAPSMEEVWGCLDECNGDKAPDPDGFNIKFYQEFWNVIKDDIMAVFNEFHRTGAFVHSIKSIFLVITPKVAGAKNIKDFRPINLVGSLYKLISKVLAKRMSNVMGEVIGENQNAFVEGRQILDAVMVVNEVVDDLVGQKKEGIICKIDMEKAYDRVCWDFVLYMMEWMGFGNRWRKWMKICMSTTSFAVMINGEPSSFFKASRGFRQGDHLSPLLFLMVMEAFSRLMESLSVGLGESAVKVFHLFFVDDTLIFCELDLYSLLHLRCSLICFQMMSGLRINLSKTEMVRIGDWRDERELASVLGCNITELPIKYLGLPRG